MPKVLILDIETSPIIVKVWQIWNQFIRPDQIIKDWTILSWSAKWLGEKEVLHMDTRKKKDPRDDKEVVTGMHKLMGQADIIVTQNGKKFDVKKLNARFKFHKLKPLPPYRHYDTKQVAKNKFGFTSNSLKELCQYLGLKTQKSEHKKFPGQKLWDEVEKGNPEAWKEMHKYNDLDVIATEGVYKELEPWDPSINANIYTNLEEVKCRVVTCQSSRLHSRGITSSDLGVYKRYQCQDCGAWTKGRTNLLTKEQKENLRKKA